ncbi:MAG: imidazole glycerol phosphate synthase subunit HisH [Planctomycetia bacterium]|nr:imidazole glycerol phosphate synthase subunit HisH [Planctomycetia bacterium]
MNNITIIDYGMGNLRSVQKAFEKVGAEAQISSDPDLLRKSTKIVLPGVGAVADAMNALVQFDLVDSIREAVRSGKPFLGICLGFQLLFERSEENGGQDGLGILPGQVLRFDLPHEFPVPHIGWNELHFRKKVPLFNGLSEGNHVYFVHSYYVKPTDDSLIATETDYGISFCSSIARENLFATQFHPEKSQSIGLKILENFAHL